MKWHYKIMFKYLILVELVNRNTGVFANATTNNNKWDGPLQFLKNLAYLKNMFVVVKLKLRLSLRGSPIPTISGW